LSATTDPSGSATSLDKAISFCSASDFLQHHGSHSTIDSVSKLDSSLDLDGHASSASRSSRYGLLLPVSENERDESSLVSFTRSREPTAPYTIQENWGPTLYDPADQQQDEKCGSVTMTAIPIRTQHADWHQSPKTSAALSRRSLPIQFKTAAAPAISTVTAMSPFGKLSWDPNNTPFRSPRSYMFMKSSAQSIQRSSMGSKAYEDLLSMSSKMGSLSLRS
jgi:hypothetical protein